MSTVQEINWVQASQTGDRNAFAKLVEQYQGMVTGIAYAILGDFARSEDAGQEAFLEAWQGLSSLNEPGKFAPWICTIARRRAIDLARKQKPTIPLASGPESASQQAGVVEQLATEEEKAIVWSTLDSLPDKYRETMVLFYRSDQSVKSVAQSLGEKEATIRQRLKRGREMLRQGVAETVERTLRNTTPSPAFVLGIMGALPGTLKTSAALTAASSSSTTGKALLATAGAAKTGALHGLLGGIGGGLLGAFVSWRNARFDSQRKLVVRSTLVAMVLTAIFLVCMYGLVSGLFGIKPNTRSYSIGLLTLIFGFQALWGGWFLWLFIAWKKVTRVATESGETVLPLAAKHDAIQNAGQDRLWTSKLRFLNLPLVDVQFWSKNSIEEHAGIPQPARGWIAIGDRAYGGLIGCGQLAVAPIAFGNIAVGLLSFGLISIGVISIGTIALGGFALGAIALGGICCGGAAIGGFAAAGLAVGYCAVGGAAFAIQAARGGVAWSMNYADGGAGGQAFGRLTQGAELEAFFSQHWFFPNVEPFLTRGFSQWVAIILMIAVAITVVRAAANAAIARRVNSPDTMNES